MQKVAYFFLSFVFLSILMSQPQSPQSLDYTIRLMNEMIQKQSHEAYLSYMALKSKSENQLKHKGAAAKQAMITSKRVRYS